MSLSMNKFLGLFILSFSLGWAFTAEAGLKAVSTSGSGGGGSGTVNSGTAPQAAYYATSGSAVSSTSLINIGTSSIGIGTATPNTLSILDLSGANNSLLLPIGTTGQRPSTGVNGMIRYNSTTPAIEGYVNNAWSGLAPTVSPTFTGTVTLPASQVVNGVTLTTGSSSSTFLNGAGSYSTPSGGGGSSTIGTSLSATSPNISGDLSSGLYSTIGSTIGIAAGGSDIVNIGTAGLSVPAFTSVGLVTNTAAGALVSTALNALCGVSAFTAAQCSSFFGYYDPRWYGAKVDGVYSTALVTTANSPNVTGYSFTSANVGMPITLYAGAQVSATCTGNYGQYAVTCTSTSGLQPYQEVSGFSGAFPVGTYVESVADSTHAIFSQTAVGNFSAVSGNFTSILNTTISSVSGTTAVMAVNATSGLTTRGWFGSDDTTAYTTAINAVNTAGGGQIKMPVGISLITSPLPWYSNLYMTGEGIKSTLKWASANNMSITNGAVIYSSTGTQQTPISNIGFSNFHIDVSSGTEGTLSYYAGCIAISVTQNWSLTNMYLEGSPASCIRNDSAANFIATNNFFAHTGRLSTGSGTGGNAIGASYAEAGIQYPTSSVVSNNIIYDPGVTGILYQASASTNAKSDALTVTGNIIYYDGFSQNTTNIAAIDEAGGFNPVISGNVVIAPPSTNTTNVGIEDGLGDDGAAHTPSYGGIISNNTVYGMGISYYMHNQGTLNYKLTNNIGSYAGAGSCFSLRGSTLADSAFDFSNNTGSYCAASGLALFYVGSETLSNFRISNNIFFDNGTLLTDYTSAGISLHGVTTLSGLTMDGNIIYDDGAATQKYGISLDTSTVITNATIRNNTFKGLTTSVFSFGSGSSITGIVQGNVGMPAPTITGCGTPTGVSGNGDIGKFTAQSSSCAAVITPYGTTNIIANNGYVCDANDLTSAFVPATGLGLITQTASTTTTATLTGVLNSSDVVNFACRMW